MTGNEILNQAYILLNYTDSNGNIDSGNNASINKRSLSIVNQIYADLWDSQELFEPLHAMHETINLNAHAVFNVMPYGVAMLIAQSEGDADNQSLYASLYNQRRPSAFEKSGRIADKLPITFF
jgi:hypothetical protein